MSLGSAVCPAIIFGGAAQDKDIEVNRRKRVNGSYCDRNIHGDGGDENIHVLRAAFLPIRATVICDIICLAAVVAKIQLFTSYFRRATDVEARRWS